VSEPERVFNHFPYQYSKDLDLIPNIFKRMDPPARSFKDLTDTERIERVKKLTEDEFYSTINNEIRPINTLRLIKKIVRKKKFIEIACNAQKEEGIAFDDEKIATLASDFFAKMYIEEEIKIYADLLRKYANYYQVKDKELIEEIINPTEEYVDMYIEYVSGMVLEMSFIGNTDHFFKRKTTFI
jgi:hypothetical protein